MSLIIDALKTRERKGQGNAKNPEPLIDGFFPYVSSDPVRTKSRRTPLLVLGGAGMVVLAIVAFLAWPRQQKPVPPKTLTVPPVAKAPMNADTALPKVAVSEVASVPRMNEEPTAAPRSAPVQAAPQQAAVRGPAVPRTLPAAATPVTTETPSREATNPRPQAAPVRVDHEARAAALFNAGDFAGARDEFVLATRVSPTARAWTNYGVTLQQLGDNSGAAAAYQSAIGIDANYLEAWLYQGRLAVALGDVGRAIPMFQRARAIDSRNADVNIELARLEYDAKNWSEARRFAEEAIRGDPKNFRGHWYLAVSSDALKDVDGAVRGYTAYLQTIGDAERGQAQFVGWARERLAVLRGKP
jgi:Tfp pilus assembly protein PilF